MYNAFVEGSTDRQLKENTRAVATGYFAAYYTNARHKKPMKEIIAQMQRQRDISFQKVYESTQKDCVDMDAEVAKFQERERRRLGG